MEFPAAGGALKFFSPIRVALHDPAGTKHGTPMAKRIYRHRDLKYIFLYQLFTLAGGGEADYFLLQ